MSTWMASTRGPAVGAAARGLRGSGSRVRLGGRPAAGGGPPSGVTPAGLALPDTSARGRASIHRLPREAAGRTSTSRAAASSQVAVVLRAETFNLVGKRRPLEGRAL